MLICSRRSARLAARMECYLSTYHPTPPTSTRSRPPSTCTSSGYAETRACALTLMRRTVTSGLKPFSVILARFLHNRIPTRSYLSELASCFKEEVAGTHLQAVKTAVQGDKVAVLGAGAIPGQLGLPVTTRLQGDGANFAIIAKMPSLADLSVSGPSWQQLVAGVAGLLMRPFLAGLVPVSEALDCPIGSSNGAGLDFC
jgi:hypothetical protein